jgi:hypothetical protein
MRTLSLICVVGLLSGATVSVALRASSGRVQDDAQQPWQIGRCYRVFPAERDQTYVFKVLDPPAGQWLRVQSDPAAPRVPGAGRRCRCGSTCSRRSRCRNGGARNEARLVRPEPDTTTA